MAFRKKRKGPKRGEARLADLISRVYPSSEPLPHRLFRVLSLWPKIVPPRFAENARPVQLRQVPKNDDELIVHASTSAWAQEFSYRIPEVQRALEKQMGLRLSRIRVRTGPLPKIPQVVAEETVHVIPLRRDQLPYDLVQFLDQLEDDPLKQVMATAMQSSLGKRREP